MPNPPAIELQYDQRAIPWHRRKRFRRIALLLLAAGLLLGSWPVIRPMIDRASFYRLQLTTAATPTLSGQLLVTTSTTQPTAVPTSLVNAASLYLPRWQRMRAWVFGPTPGTLLMVHQRTTLSGENRVVMVYAALSPTQADGRREVELWSHAYFMPRLGWIAWPDTQGPDPGQRLFADLGNTRWRITLNAGDLLDIFAGQIDPADASRLLIPYHLNGKSYQFDATLTDNHFGWNGQSNAGLVFTRNDPLMANYPGAGDRLSLTPSPAP